jgi:arylamine N-acetyltransferase
LSESTNTRFRQAATSFLSGSGLGPVVSPDLSSLKEIYPAFGQLPYENVSKIISHHREGGPESPGMRSPAEVIEGFLADRLGGTCFSLTQALWSLLGFCGFECYRVLGDMLHGPNIHCAVVVQLPGEKYLCDAGYLVPEPLRIDPSGKSILKGPLYTYLLEADPRSEGVYQLYTRSPGGKAARWRYLIRDRAVSDMDFERFWRLSFDAPMNRQLLLTRNLDQGQVYIHKHKLRLTTVRGHTNNNIRLDLPERIEELFGIDRDRVTYALSLIEQSETINRDKPR